MKKLLLIIPTLFLTSCTIGSSLVFAGAEEAPKTKITILDQIDISRNPTKGIPFSEISDLAYNQHENKLYMIGDKGYFYSFLAKFEKKIEEFTYVDGFKINEKKRQKSYDSEGLTLDNKGELYLSLEGKPRISKISKKGILFENQTLTKELKNSKNYTHGNGMLEALAWHPKFGLITAAEFPMFKRKNTEQTLYSLHGKVWNFKAEKHKNSAITAMEVMDDGNILILERAYAGLSQPFVITLKKLYLDKCNKKNNCQTEVLASFNNQDGWSINNYEGLTKVGKNRYLMVSDDSNKSYLSTVFVYFKVNK
jgi:hypothetical protein